jgi:hypothetical protein
MNQKDSKIADSIVKRVEALDSTFGTTENVLQKISEYILPSRGDFTRTSTPGERKDIELYDTTGVNANELLSSAVTSGLTSNSTRWFDLVVRDLETSNDDEVKRYLAKVHDIMFKVFNSSDVNFSQQNHAFMIDLVAYGTSCMYIDEIEGEGLRFSARHLSEIRICENNKGVIDTVFRQFKFTPRQAVQEWGEEALHQDMSKMIKDKPDEELDFVHGVLPRKDAERQFGPIDLPEKFTFVGYYVDKKNKHVVDVKGFFEQPYLIARWEQLVGEVYGRGPGWNALADVLMLNKMSENKIRAAEKSLDPPLLMADDGVILPLETFPGGVNIGGVSQDGRPLIQHLQTGGRVEIALDEMEQRRESVRRAYFVDQFVPKQGTPVTATEFAQRKEDDLRLTGPHLFRVRSEYLSKVIDRVFNILQRNGAFPAAPEALEGVDLEVEYISPLVRAQKFDELVAFNRGIESVLPILESNPEALDNIDPDALFRKHMEIAGVSVQNMRKLETTKSTSQTVEEIREQRQAAIEQQQQQQQMMEGAGAVADLKSAGVEIPGV